MAKQLEFRFHGGKRKNAGRKNRSGLNAHTKRPRVDFRKPLHVTLKSKASGLRKPQIFSRMKQACRRLKRFGVHVIQFAMLGDHIHMIIEARNNPTLASGMKSITGTFAKRFETRFKGRYHLQVITTPTQMKSAYKYVLLNFAKHSKQPPHIDPYSSGSAFTAWAELAHTEGDAEKDSPDSYGLSEPRSWLAQRGWRPAA